MRSLFGLVVAAAAFVAAGCYEGAGTGDGADGDADTDTDPDGGPDCVAECGACDTDGTPCCGGTSCLMSILNPPERCCQPDTFVDSELCADISGACGEACAPLGLYCVFWDTDSDSDSGGTERECTCDGWTCGIID